MMNLLPAVLYIFMNANLEMATLSHSDLKMELTDLSYDIEEMSAAGEKEQVLEMSKQTLAILEELKRRDKLNAEDEDLIVSFDKKLDKNRLKDKDVDLLLNRASTYSFHRAKVR